MESLKSKKVLISGAGIAGLTTAYWMNKAGYKVTVVEIAGAPRTGGTPVDLQGKAIGISKRMGLFDQIKASRLGMEVLEYKNVDDVTEGKLTLKKADAVLSEDDIEIERDKFTDILFNAVKDDVEFIFNTSISALTEITDGIAATFKNGQRRTFNLVLGCDGSHSTVRELWFGHEEAYTHFLKQYFSISIVNRLLIRENTMQMFNVPGKAIMLNAYNNKTDIVFCFYSEQEISYDYRDTSRQIDFILEQFEGEKWRTAELLEEVKNPKNFYFDKLCQIKMPSWTKGRVALIGDSGYCASPAAGMGGSLAMIGAATLADALQKHGDHFELAFQEYNSQLRPFIEEVQESAVQVGIDFLVPRTEEAIRERNANPMPF